MSQNKTYSLLSLRRLDVKGYKKLKINKIVKTSNFGKDCYDEEFICENINPHFIFAIYKMIDERLNREYSTHYYKACSEDYKLHIGMVQ